MDYQELVDDWEASAEYLRKHALDKTGKGSGNWRRQSQIAARVYDRCSSELKNLIEEKKCTNIKQ